eukprot:TRINITY_DN2239_c0_g1_i1.p1 TRINITY_DN2239_c0_g1~~TRINITY_DN2239_c0_g1_i1.p1  ORF type:complete len:121 (-),score=13.75 TRINITY_DN2239_c0_g1_i1:747-1109(-)
MSEDIIALQHGDTRIIGIYRKHKSDIDLFLNTLNRLITDNTIIAGDFNAALLETHKPSVKLTSTDKRIAHWFYDSNLSDLSSDFKTIRDPIWTYRPGEKKSKIDYILGTENFILRTLEVS